MDFVSGLLVTLPQPAGFWESIINAFGGVNGTYIIAVIILALLIRVVLSFFDIFKQHYKKRQMIYIKSINLI